MCVLRNKTVRNKTLRNKTLRNKTVSNNTKCIFYYIFYCIDIKYRCHWK